MPILQFPSLEDRTNVHNLIIDYANKRVTLTKMMTTVAEIVEQYKVLKFPVFDYSVKVIHSKHASHPIISIDSARMSDNCPVCGSDESGYLRTEKENLDLEYDVVSTACMDCSCVYLSRGKNLRANTKKGVN